MHSKELQLPGHAPGHEKILTVHHDGDYSGDVILVVKQRDEVVTYKPAVNDGTYEIALPYEILERIVLGKLRSEAISDLEEADYDELRRRMFKHSGSKKGRTWPWK